MSSPEIRVDGIKRTMTSNGTLIEPGGSAVIDLDSAVRTKNFKNLRELLMRHRTKHKDKKRYFWPDAILRRILSRSRVREELKWMEERKGDYRDIFAIRTVEQYTDIIVAKETGSIDKRNGADNAIDTELADIGDGSQEFCFMKVFAILLLCEHEFDIGVLIDSNIHDGCLPLLAIEPEHSQVGQAGLALRSRPSESLSCFHSWSVSTIEVFEEHQYRFLVPYLCLPSDNTATCKDVKFYQQTILPIAEEDITKATQGAYGAVTCVRIVPDCHGFHEVQQFKACKGLFAVKTMLNQDLKDFEKEKMMSKLLGRDHKNIIRLLMTYELNNYHYLLFPWADSDLERYWSTKRPPFDAVKKRMDKGLMRWVSEQIVGLTSGLHNIHNPTYLPPDSQKRWGRHGDIKPDNILWFQGSNHTESVLVLNDLGLSSIHGIKSRSNVPNEAVPAAPDYRPPECDQKDGKISRAFDIWTLGCLFLDMVCWILGGYARKQEFEYERLKVPYLGAGTNIFFDVKITHDGESVILVKESVVECVRLLHEHPGCTDYLHELLDIISQRMIIVLSSKSDRIRSGDLLTQLQGMHDKIDENGYGWQPKPYAKFREPDVPVAVVVTLNEHAYKRFETFKDHLGKYNGRLLDSKQMGHVS